MKCVRIAVLALLAIVVTGAPPAASGKIKVIATVPNLGSIAEAIGGDRVAVTTIATGFQDAHYVDPKPSFITRLRSADLFLVNGLDLEIGWVPPLTRGARNARIMYGGEGYIDCSLDIDVMEVPTRAVSRAQGDIHPYGNPHYLTDPLNAEIVAAQIARAFARVSPADADLFEQRRAAFVRRLHEAMFGSDLVDLIGGPHLARLARTGQLDGYLESTELDGRPLLDRLGGWLGRLRPHAGAKIVTYHKDYTYFAARFDLDVVDYVEVRPGIPPTAKHIAELTALLRAGEVRLLNTRPYVKNRFVEQLHERTRVPVLTLPLEVGGAEGVDDYIELYDHVTAEIAAVLSGSQPEAD